MAEDQVQRDLMRYDLMAQEALRGVVRQSLERAASPRGIPGDHHFYISFLTHAPGVSVPPDLAERYPDEMTIVMQHQFWELAPGETEFSVVLRFGGQPKKLTVPYVAVTRFHDPSVPFALQFDAIPDVTSETSSGPASGASSPAQGPDAAEQGASRADAEPASAAPEGPKIVSLDQFRKK